MTRYGKYALGAVCVLVVAMIGSLVGVRRASAQNGGIGPAPSRPATNAPGAPPPGAIGTGATPAPAPQNLGADAGQPFQELFPLTFEDGSSETSYVITVPEGNRWVIEYSAAAGLLPAGHRVLLLLSTQLASGQGGDFPVPTQIQTGFAGDQLVAAQPMRVYADGGTPVTVRAFRNATAGMVTFGMTISGRLLPMQ